MTKTLLFSIFFLLPCVAFAQYEKEIDSLNKIIHSKVDSAQKIEPYAQLIEIYFETNPEKSIEKIKELYQLNKNNSCLKCETMADFCMGNYHEINGDGKNALRYFEKAAQKSLNSKDYEFYQLSKSFKINTYFNVSDLANAEAELKAYFALTKKLNLKTGYEEMYYTSGLINRKKGFFNTAIEDLLNADKIIVDTKRNKMKLRTSVLSEIALTYKDLRNYKKAMEYIDKSEKQSEKSQDIYGQMYAKLIRGRIEIDFKNYENAVMHLEKAYHYFKSIQNDNFIAICEFSLGVAYYHLNQYPKSVGYLEHAAIGLKNSGNIDVYASCLSYLGKNNLKFNQFIAAKTNIDSAKAAVQNKKDFPLYLSILETEIDYHKKTNNYAAALQVIHQKDSLSKIITEKTNITNLNELEAKYQNEKKEQQIQLLSAKNELAQKQQYIYFALLGLLILVGASLIYGYRNKIKTARKLNELNTLKSRFFANISHEFRTPLTLIKSPLQTLQASKIDVNQKEQLALIDSNSDRMLELVNQLLELSKIDSGHFKLILKESKLDDFLHSIVDPFAFQAKENGISFVTNIEKMKSLHYFDKDVIQKIASNLLSNAFKYGNRNQPIYFSATIEHSDLLLQISNSDNGLKNEDLPKLFERFYQKNEAQNSSGIGLALVKELVELYNGSIETALESQSLRFLIRLPLHQDNPNAIQTNSKNSVSVASESATVVTATNTEELPILLIVDDNAEIRKVISGIFASEYKILEAPDGEKALQMAQKEIPDCIISDIMMPKMDGLAFTFAIKNNELTSFIPLILLTAKMADETHLEALKHNADAFLTKPFNHEILKATVAQLRAERRLLQERYSQELVLRPMDIVINSVDEKFLDKLQKVLENEISNSGFSTDDFAKELGMSRMQLHRKLKTLIGVSATEFLRNERLKLAAGLLKKGNANVSEIAYVVGFNDSSYFSKCFKERYNVTPSEYMETN